jgi:branched-chain amino acid transport system substrate-binding protein
MKLSRQASNIGLAISLIFSASIAFAEDGVTDTEIHLGGNAIFSGPYGFYGVVPTFAKAYFQWINETEGGINGRKIVFDSQDDVGNPTKSLEIIRRQVEKDKILATFLDMGGFQQATIQYLEKKKVPNMFISDSSDKYTRPTSPYRFDLMPLFYDEAFAMGTWVAEHMKGKKVGFLILDAPMGTDGVAGAKAAMKDSVKYGPIEKVGFEAVNADQQIINLQKENVDVIFAFAVPPLVPNAIKFAHSKGWNPTWMLQLYNANGTTVKMLGDADKGNIMSNQYLHYEYEDIPGIKRNKEILAKYMPGTNSDNLTIYAQYGAEIMAETIKRAGKKLTRASLAKAAESFKDWQCSVCRVKVNTSKDNHHPMGKPEVTKLTNGNWTYINN